MPHPALWPNLAWWATRAPGYRRFVRGLADPEGTQERRLVRILRRNAGTVFGRLHGFAGVRSSEDYRRRVPPSTYEDCEPFVRRIMAGERAVLTREPVLRLLPTSGSTSAAKLVPFTASLHREFLAGIAPWIFDLYRRRPGLLGGPAYWSISPAIAPVRPPSAVAIGHGSDTFYLGGLWGRLLDRTLVAPARLDAVRDVDAFRRSTLLALVQARGLRLISVWHPSFLTLLLDALPASWEWLVESVPDDARRRELMACGPHDHRRIWPRLGLISCWADGPAEPCSAGIRRRFPGVSVQPKGLLATEAFVSLPLASAMPVAVCSHFFEFEADDGRMRLLHELEAGGVYSVLVTTGGGLYRYRLHDRVRVTGFARRTPCVRFLAKEDHVADGFGEKLSEGFVADLLRRLFRELRVEARFALLAPDRGPGGPGYTLFAETEEPLPRVVAERLEAELRRNPHYRYCTALGQLAPARVFRIEHGGFAAYLERCVQQGQRPGDVKPVLLNRNPGWAATFRGTYLRDRHDRPHDRTPRPHPG